jgi:hypothetical protein
VADECCDVAVPIAAQLLELREEVRVLPPAVEERDVVAARERGLDDVTPDEDRPAEDEKVQRPLRSIRPGKAPVGLPWSMTTLPPTIT